MWRRQGITGRIEAWGRDKSPSQMGVPGLGPPRWSSKRDQRWDRHSLRVYPRFLQRSLQSYTHSSLLKNYMQKIKNGKAPGIDGLPAEFSGL
ncbi:unnamed protein product [Pleuronectes platessa]|uniref:Uncharacterized protein n=1 Tax=Pleuronectes platessa TaxID=8262 RepID=A0A9N7TNY3_PLEPL|nr:unnamed protein product [Pleuronectes platessa]